eukprot:TRINITY_DN2455_c0_g1_i2.p1 TRINITY_DN2455_c0_g1~~TRINITY_DN2455_c0_g1_i2.p1  ORF type:complete len:387 (-),score=133.21 TRINITY_DN2455_c0_g1_i2:61-1173(-)
MCIRDRRRVHGDIHVFRTDMSLIKELKAGRTAKCLEIIQTLSDLNVKDPAKDKWAIHYAIEEQSLEILGVLLKPPGFITPADPNVLDEDGYSPLTLAIQQNFVEAVKLLVTHKADVNKVLPNGKVPLHYAVQANTTSIIKLLLDNGADPNLKSEEDGTPLHFAISEMCYENALFLIEQKQNSFSETNSAQESPLHLAVRLGAGGVVEKILQRLKDSSPGEANEILNQRNKDGNTILHESQVHGKTTIYDLLLRVGVPLGLDAEARNKKGETAEVLKVAREKHEREEAERALQNKKEASIRNRNIQQQRKVERIEKAFQEEEDRRKEEIRREIASKELRKLDRNAPYVLGGLLLLAIVGMYLILKLSLIHI